MIDKQKKLKICLAASAGGHLVQLLKISDCWKNDQRFFVTTSETVREKLSKDAPVFVVGECNRQHRLKVLGVFFKCLKIIFRHRPDVILSSGAAHGCMLCFLGKFLGKKVIWLDSIANVEKLSMSGRMVRPIADLILTQWPEVAKKYKNVEFAGSVI